MTEYIPPIIIADSKFGALLAQWDRSLWIINAPDDVHSLIWSVLNASDKPFRMYKTDDERTIRCQNIRNSLARNITAVDPKTGKTTFDRVYGTVLAKVGLLNTITAQSIRSELLSNANLSPYILDLLSNIIGRNILLVGLNANKTIVRLPDILLTPFDKTKESIFIFYDGVHYDTMGTKVAQRDGSIRIKTIYRSDHCCIKRYFGEPIIIKQATPITKESTGMAIQNKILPTIPEKKTVPKSEIVSGKQEVVEDKKINTDAIKFNIVDTKNNTITGNIDGIKLDESNIVGEAPLTSVAGIRINKNATSVRGQSDNIKVEISNCETLVRNDTTNIRV